MPLWSIHYLHPIDVRYGKSLLLSASRFLSHKMNVCLMLTLHYTNKSESNQFSCKFKQLSDSEFITEKIRPTHTLITCSFSSEVANWLMKALRLHVPALQPKQVVLLLLGDVQDSLYLPLVWLIANTLALAWNYRKEKKRLSLHSIQIE